MAVKRVNKRPSMFEVAKLAGVSHQTVSRVINDSPDVSAATRAKVEAAIRELDYHPSNSARALASRRSRTIGLIAGGLRFFGPISAIASIEDMARSHGLFMSVSMVHDASCTQEEFAQLCDAFSEQNVDAFIFLTPTDAMFAAACQVKVNKPRVVVTATHGSMSMREGLARMRRLDRAKVAAVGIDQWGAVEGLSALIAEYGHREALYFAGPMEWRDARTRADAWKASCARLHMHSNSVRCSSWDSGEAYARMNHVLEEYGRRGVALPSVVVCANDGLAVGVARALHEHGVRVGQDVGLVGFDDMPAMDNLFVPLTTVRPDFAQLGVAAMRQVLHLLGEAPEPVFVGSRHGVGLIPADVVKRASLGRVTIR